MPQNSKLFFTALTSFLNFISLYPLKGHEWDENGKSTDEDRILNEEIFQSLFKLNLA